MAQFNSAGSNPTPFTSSKGKGPNPNPPHQFGGRAESPAGEGQGRWWPKACSLTATQMGKGAPFHFISHLTWQHKDTANCGEREGEGAALEMAW